MGGERGKRASTILDRKKSRKAKRDIGSKLKQGSPKIAAMTVFKWAAASEPTIYALYVAYKFAKFTYPIVEKGVKEYDKTGDQEKAVEKMKSESIIQVKREIKEATVEKVVEVTYAATKEASGIVSDRNTDVAITTATSETIKEMIK